MAAFQFLKSNAVSGITYLVLMVGPDFRVKRKILFTRLSSFNFHPDECPGKPGIVLGNGYVVRYDFFIKMPEQQ